MLTWAQQPLGQFLEALPHYISLHFQVAVSAALNLFSFNFNLLAHINGLQLNFNCLQHKLSLEGLINFHLRFNFNGFFIISLLAFEPLFIIPSCKGFHFLLLAQGF